MRSAAQTRHVRSRVVRRLIAGVTVAAAVVALAAVEQPAGATPRPGQGHVLTGKGPVGWDVYRRLDQFDRIPQGVQTKQFSSFDRAGGNGDFNRCLSTRSDGSCVLAQADGPGEIDSIWSTRDGGDVTATGDITVVLDGRTVIHAPFQDVVDGKLGAPFVYPIVSNADQSSGGVNIQAPMPYRRSMLVYVDKDPNYYHVTYRSFADADGVTTFDPSDKATDVIAMLKAAGTKDPKPAAVGATTQRREVDLAPGRSVTLADLRGPGAVSALRVQVPSLVAPPTPDLVSDDGRAFGAGGYSQFTVAVDPANTGVRLIRRADNGIGSQRADVLVDGVKVAQWQPNEVAGACKWGDEVVDLPASATAGKSRITIRNSFVSSALDFNEFGYTVESTVAGKQVRTDSVDVGPEHAQDEAAHDYSIVDQTWQGTQRYCYASDDTRDPAVVATGDVLRDVRVQVTADGTRTVDAPLGQFFGNGQTDDDVRALLSSMGAGLDDWFSAWWPMPYAHSITVTLRNGSTHPLRSVRSAVTSARDRTVPQQLAAGRIGYFRATSNDADTVPGQDYTFLRTAGTGKFVGVSHSMVGPASRAYLEGDERVYVDGSRTPQIHGTGTEDFYEGGWYFNRDTFSDPVNGEPGHQAGPDYCAADADCSSVYRLMLTDAVPFSSSLDFGIEHGPVDDVQAHYSSTAWWYGTARYTARVTDTVDVGDPASERAHRYSGGGEVTSLTATYEGDNGAPQPVTDDLRATDRPVSFRVALDRRNAGAVLRRTSDQAHPGQRVAVDVDGVRVGTWDEPLDNATHRWLDDEFQLPAWAVAGRGAVTVTLRPAAGSSPWTAARYSVRSLVAPFTDRRAPGRVTDLTATAGTTSDVRLSWSPAADDVGIDHYDVYAAQGSSVPVDAAHRVGSVRVPGFTDTGLPLRQRYSYRVVAVDLAGNRGPASATASTTTGATVRVEAERQLPAVDATGPVEAQGNCCGISWSGGAQLWLRATGPGQHVTIAFTVPTTGTYAVSAVQTQAPDYGISTLAIDGTAAGAPLDGYHAGGVVVTTVDGGTRSLTAGRHELTLTVTGKDAAATGYLAGLDLLDLRLTS